MLEPTTISVSNLAIRWNQTPNDILEHAANLRLRLLFNFDGVAVDANVGNLTILEWLKKREHEELRAFVKNANQKFKRRVNGQLSEWESLDSEEAVSLRAEVITAQAKIKELDEFFDAVTRERLKYGFRGHLMAPPATVSELLRLGFAAHPIHAFRPEGPFVIHTVNGVQVLDGPMVRLEPGITQWKERLELADMVVKMEDVNAIEAHPSTTPPPAVAPTTPDIDPADLPKELDMANMAFRAVSNGHGNPADTFRNRLITYLKETYPTMTNEEITRIATVANPDKTRGRKPKIKE